MSVAKSLIRRVSIVVTMVALGFAPRIAFAQTDDAAASSVQLTTLGSFTGANGLGASSPLIQASNGEFYGMTTLGGTGTYCGGLGCGTIFKIAPSGALTTLYSFLCSPSGCPNGQDPNGALLQATNGDLYGTTQNGGTDNVGTIFKITPSGELTTLYSFLCSQSGCLDGRNPSTALFQAANGDLYGTTQTGGANFAGTIFKFTPSGALTTLYSFCSESGCPDGQYPSGPLIQANNGYLYGTTQFGGTHNSSGYCPSGCGTIFKISTTGKLTTLYNLCTQSNCADGAESYGGLVQANNGDLYGTTTYGGIATSTCPFGCGTIFSITPSGTLTTLYKFCSEKGFQCPDGDAPNAGLVQADSGNLLGTTPYGGANRYGTIFKIKPEGMLTTLYSFCSQAACADGASPNGLIQSTNGKFYGTTSSAGGYGVFFSLSTGQGPFVQTRPTSGKVGKTVTILGYELTGVTSVRFNGEPAAFTVHSDTEITATVPASATTGKVQVITPNGALLSNVSFGIVP
jgi:uncharacterized repeat protein (TIGR03803 family)